MERQWLQHYTVRVFMRQPFIILDRGMGMQRPYHPISEKEQ